MSAPAAAAARGVLAAAAAQPVKASGMVPVEIHSVPPRAKVSSGDLECITPCTLELARGERYVKTELAGYKTVFQRVMVPSQVQVDVKLEQSVGWIDVGGPAGSTVYVDGTAWSRPAPVSIPVPPGDHSVYLIYPDKRKSNEQKLAVREDVRYQLTLVQ